MSWNNIETDVWGILYSILGRRGVICRKKMDKGDGGTLNSTIGWGDSHEWKKFLDGDFNPVREH